MAASPALALGTGISSLRAFNGVEAGRTRYGGGLVLPAAAISSSSQLCFPARLKFCSRGCMPCLSGHGKALATVSLPEEELWTDRGAVVELEEEKEGSAIFFLQRAVLMVAAGLTPVLLHAPDAMAAGGEFGILEGRSFALLHPIAMGGLFLYTLYAGYLGWQWRSVRTVQDEINELKKQVPAGTDGAPAPPSPLDGKIKELTNYRKELIKGNFRDRHFNSGSILLAFGVFEAVGGSLNTWFRTGKLFPGPHLFAGAGITVLWALAAALVPAMQKGNDTARSAHIALNAINVALFIWQIPTGWEIVGKVFEFTTWP